MCDVWYGDFLFDIEIDVCLPLGVKYQTLNAWQFDQFALAMPM